jgi:catechol 2,3-dioxygenase-like lactoylglutathione lyase family enzyme
MKWAIGIIGALALAAVSPAFAAGEDDPGPRLGAVRIAVSDYKKATDFYVRLGMKAGDIYTPAERGLKWDTATQGSGITLFHDETGKSKLVPGTNSLSFVVPDIKATAKSLRDGGYPDIGEPKNYKTAMLLMVKDPDGNQIELVQVIPKSP